MKTYTIKEFAEGQKAVKIENEEQWAKLNKVHELCRYHGTSYYTNKESYTSDENYLKLNSWEVLEFSQLNFEDKFVAGKWYKVIDKTSRIKYIKYLKTEPTGYFWCSEHISNMYGNCGGTFGVNNAKDLVEVSLKEIQQYLPKGHIDLIKKDTFVLPEKWAVRITENNIDCINKARGIKSSIGFFCTSRPLGDKGWGYNVSILPYNFTEITFEQFKTHILKESTMEKEIIGYKLVKPEYKEVALKICNTFVNWENSLAEYDISVKQIRYVNKLKEAGVLDLWFEPVYKEEFKVGEWVSFSNATRTKTITSKLKEWTAHNYCILENGEKPFKDIIRKATEEEVKKASILLPKINGYKGSYSNGIIKYGYAEFNVGFFEDLAELDGYSGNRTIESIELSSGVKITIQQIKQIVEYINNNK